MFPLAVKKSLSDQAMRTLDELDSGRLSQIEQLVLVDPYSIQSAKMSDEPSHPWSEWQTFAHIRKLTRLLREDVAAVVDGTTIAVRRGGDSSKTIRAMRFEF